MGAFFLKKSLIITEGEKHLSEQLMDMDYGVKIS